MVLFYANYLRKWHIIVVNWCCMCKMSGEATDNLLLYCDIARELWTMVFNFFGVQWIMPQGVAQLLACLQGRFCQHHSIDIWKVIPHRLMWCIWIVSIKQNHKGFVLHSRCGSVVSMFARQVGQHHSIDIWKVIPHCLMWCIWRERNAMIFEWCESSVLDLKLLLLISLFEWMTALG